MAIVTHYPLLLRELRYAAPARVKVWKGTATLRSGEVVIALREGESFSVPSFVRFSCLAHPRLAPGMARPAVWSLALEAEPEGEDGAAPSGMAQAADASKPFTRALAAAIFADPGADWRTARIAAQWQLTPARLRALLFAEGESLRSLVREQRVAWRLARLAGMAVMAGDFASAGFASLAAMEQACQDVIGLPPEVAARAIALQAAGSARTAVATAAAQRQPRYRRYF